MKLTRIAALLVLAFALAYGWAATTVLTTASMASPELGEAGTLVVLGKRLVNGEPDADFQARIQRLDSLLTQSHARQAIATGGSMGAPISEAALVALSLPHHTIVLEEMATTTRENLRFVQKLADPSQPMGVITSRYHLARTQLLAQQKGMELVLIPAEAQWEWSSSNLKAVAREALLYWPAKWGW